MGFAEDSYLFRHAMMRLAAYELQPPVERSELHAYAYGIIEALPHDDPDAIAYELAGHARGAAAHDPDQRRSAEMHKREGLWLERAMQRARENSSFRIALECAERLIGNTGATVEARHAAALQGAEMSAALGELARVPEFLDHAEALHTSDDPLLRAAWILAVVNAVHLPRREYETGMELLQQAMGIYRQAGDRLGEARATGYMGNVMARQGQREEAVRRYEQAEAIFRELGHQRGLSTCRGNLGLMYKYFDQFDKAEKAYREALDIDRAIGNREGVPRHLGNLAVLCSDAGRYEEALELFDRSADLFRELGDRMGWMRNAINQATCFERTGQLHRAVTLYQQAERIADECGVPLDAADYMHHRGLVLLKMNDTVRGEPVLEQAALRLEQFGAPDTAAEAWGQLAESAFARQEMDAALRNAEAALQNLRACGRAPKFSLLALRAEAALATDLPDAARLAAQALEHADSDADPARIALLKAIANRGQASSAT
jgi:tetratricopeptide (TPR) repeat protein